MSFDDPQTFMDQGVLQRPRPRFDMNLGDLFADDETAFHQFSRPSRTVPFAQQQQQQQRARSLQNQQMSPSMQEDAFANHPGSQTTSPAMTQASPQQQTLPQMPGQMQYNAFTESTQSPYQEVGAFSDFDWLDSFPLGTGPSNPNAQFATSSGAANTNAEGNMGALDLGFGMGWDGGAGNHDWADGGSFDLFDGFFFGNGGSGSGS